MTCKQLAIKQHRSAHARAQGEQQDIANSAGRPEPVLTEQGAVAIIGQGHRALQQGSSQLAKGTSSQPGRFMAMRATRPAWSLGPGWPTPTRSASR